MKQRLIRGLALIGAISLISTVAGILVGAFESRRVQPGTVLQLDLERRIVETVPPATLSSIAYRPKPTTRQLVEGLRHAAADDRVVAIVARIGRVGMGLAQIQEIRDAVLDFRKSGKRAVIHAETFGEFQQGTGAYYLASAFDTIYLQPSGDVAITGVRAETPFLRDAFDKARIRTRFDARREYKSAVNTFTQRGYTDAHKEATGAVLRSQFEQIVAGIATARGLEAATVRTLVDRAPLGSAEALDAGLVDDLAYRDEVWAAFEDAGEPPPRLTLTAYRARMGSPDADGETVALIYGVGNVHRGQSSRGVTSGDPTMGSDTVTAAFRAAIDDEDIRAIVFRVDSPGGSYVASDVIWREVGRARRQGKPVIVSMGNVAGSGGYFVAMNADEIIAQPGTVTGSIGVLAGKLITNEFWEQFGVRWDSLQQGRHAGMWSPSRDYSASEWERFQSFLDRIYDDFTAKVAAGRDLDRVTVERVARGRIWTGEQAKENGLVDRLGGLDAAFDVVRERLALSADAGLRVVVFPKPDDLRSVLLARLMGQPDGNAELPVAAVLGEFGVVPSVRAVLSAFDQTGPLTMPWSPGVW